MFKYVIVGGGTAGWLAALFAQHMMPYSDVTVIASSEIGILGAGEGTTPHFVELLKDLDIPESDLYEHARATIKKSIKFTNWNGNDGEYFHPFYNNQYALHFDANLLAQYLQKVGISRGIKYIDDRVTGLQTKDNGDVSAIELQSGTVVPSDFVFDCSGFRRLIIGDHYKTKWNSYTDFLPVKKAIPFFIDHDNNVPDYTEAIAMKYGWVWKIPVQGRYGCGYVFDSDFIDEHQAQAEVEELLGHKITVPKAFSFNAGAYDKVWVNNCLAVGLASGFTEPMEATSIWIQVMALRNWKLMMDEQFKGDNTAQNRYNTLQKNLNEDLRNFIHMHYLTNRADSEFWTTFQERNSTPEFVKMLKDMALKKRSPLEQYDLDYARITTIEGEARYMDTYYIPSWLTVGEGTGYFNA
jgi:tryptophan halogenase